MLENDGLTLTLRHLSTKGAGDGHEVVLHRAVVHGHLPSLALVIHVAVALVHELLDGVAAVHQHSCIVQYKSSAGNLQSHFKVQKTYKRLTLLQHTVQIFSRKLAIPFQSYF